MNKNIVDARDQLCPKPIIMTKTAINNAAPDDEIDVLINKEESKNNTVKFLKDNNVPVEWEESEGVFTLHIKKANTDIKTNVNENVCPNSGLKK